MIRKKINESKKISILFFLFLLFNILFPKAGIKIEGIPITIGNILYITILPISLFILFKIQYKFEIKEIMIVCSSLYWIVRLLSYHKGTSTGDLVSYIACLCFFPLVYYIVPVYINNEIKLKKVTDLIGIFVLILIVYTIIQYIFGIGKTDVPGLTVNYTDYLESPDRWWEHKNNVFKDNGYLYRSKSTKIVSTYQNGNLFGANLFLFFPFLYFKENGIRRYVVLAFFLVTVLLTGSRTMYITLIVFGLLLLLEKLRKVRFKKISILAFVLCIIFLIPVILIAIRINSDVIGRFNTIFNWNTVSSGTGRIEKVRDFISWIYKKGNILNFIIGSEGFDYDGGAAEMTYIYIFILGGLVGLILTILPLLSIYFRTFKRNNEICKAINYGLTLYLIAANFDGGFWLPPTALNLWFLLGIANNCLNQVHN